MKIRQATLKDLSEIVKMIANDKLGNTREDFQIPLPPSYTSAFENIERDENQELVLIENDAHEIIGTLQLSFIQYLTYKGGTRAQIEAVRVREDQRGKGIGKMLFEWAIDKARRKECHLVQLTTDKKRPEALVFYENLGFSATHEGMKLHL